MTAQRDSAFEMATSRIRFGAGTTREVGWDLAELGVRRVFAVVDPAVARLAPAQVLRESLAAAGVEAVWFERVRVEPSEASFHEAIAAARDAACDGFVALGGGSTIDTAKVANLYSTYPADFLTYVNAPLGAARPIPGPLRPLIAIPTTAGTGSETTGVAICDLKERKIKTGIAHRLLKPTLGILDPENTRSAPPEVAASTGLDVLCHALESYTALPFDQRPWPERPSLRPNYQGANPISDVWVEKSLRMVAQYLQRAVADPSDDEARENMLLAAAYAGIGFGNAGVHLCHALSYPIASLVRDYHAPGYPDDHPLVPHGISVVLTAPAVFRFTAPANPARHLAAAEILGVDTTGVEPAEAGDLLADWLSQFFQPLGVPNGLEAVGYQVADVGELAQGAWQQQRLTKLSPRPVGEAELAALATQSLRLW
ncbi:MAG: hydroxyacid-oxoacid transhydrogenase [Pirellulales bacterium]